MHNYRYSFQIYRTKRRAMQVHDVDLRLLRVFVAIVECGGLSAAESRLNIGRSTISAHLSDLEVRLGIKLCKRGRSGFEITDAGAITYQASIELLQQCEAFANTVASSKNELSGRLSIAMIDTMVSDPRCAIPRAIARLKGKGKNIQFDINVCEAREVETAVANGRSLVGIGVSRHHIRGLNYTALHNETNFLYFLLTGTAFSNLEYFSGMVKGQNHCASELGGTAYKGSFSRRSSYEDIDNCAKRPYVRERKIILIKICSFVLLRSASESNCFLGRG